MAQIKNLEGGSVRENRERLQRAPFIVTRKLREVSRLAVESIASWFAIKSEKQPPPLHDGYRRWCVCVCARARGRGRLAAGDGDGIAPGLSSGCPCWSEPYLRDRVCREY